MVFLLNQNKCQKIENKNKIEKRRNYLDLPGPLAGLGLCSQPAQLAQLAASSFFFLAPTGRGVSPARAPDGTSCFHLLLPSPILDRAPGDAPSPLVLLPYSLLSPSPSSPLPQPQQRALRHRRVSPAWPPSSFGRTTVSGICVVEHQVSTLKETSRRAPLHHHHCRLRHRPPEIHLTAPLAPTFPRPRRLHRPTCREPLTLFPLPFPSRASRTCRSASSRAHHRCPCRRRGLSSRQPRPCTASRS